MPKHYFLAFTSIIAIVLVLILYFNKRLKSTYTVTIVDLSIYSFITYIAIHMVLNGENPFQSFKFLNILLVIILYILFRPFFQEDSIQNEKNKFINSLVIVLLLIGIIQPLYGFAQYFGVIQNMQLRLLMVPWL